MRQIKEVLRLKYHAGLSHWQIAASLKISVGVIAKYAAAAAAMGITWPIPDHIDEARLEALLFPVAPAPSRFVQPDFHYMRQELKRKGVTLALLWEEYCQTCAGTPYQYSQFCHRYGLYAGRLKLSMRQDHRAGEKLFVDYSGDSLCLTDRRTGEIRPTQLFIAVLGASSYTYAEATLTQKLPDWIGAHVRAFEFFGAVPALIVPDNLKSAVSRVCWYEPQINPTYAALAEHYATAILPARPGKPRDKPKAEAGVLLAQRWINARLRNHTFLYLAHISVSWAWGRSGKAKGCRAPSKAIEPALKISHLLPSSFIQIGQYHGPAIEQEPELTRLIRTMNRPVVSVKEALRKQKHE